MLDLELPWDRQPEAPTPFNADSPLASRLIAGVFNGWCFGSDGKPRPITPVGTTIGVGPDGPAFVGGSGSYVRASVPPVTLLGRQSGGSGYRRDFTLVFVISDLQAGGWLCDRQGGGSYRGVADVYKDGSGNLYANTGSGPLFSSVPLPSTARLLIVSMGTYLDSGTYIKPRAWIDNAAYDGAGTFGSPNQDSYATITVSENTWFGSSSFPTDNYMLGKGSAAFMFRGNFTDAEAAAVKRAVWRLLQPRRIPVPVSSGGAASPVAANATYYQMIAQQRIGY